MTIDYLTINRMRRWAAMSVAGLAATAVAALAPIAVGPAAAAVPGLVAVVDTADPEAALARVRELTGGAGADLVIECAGVPRAVAQGLTLARRGGSYLVVGQYTDSGDTGSARGVARTGCSRRCRCTG